MCIRDRNGSIDWNYITSLGEHYVVGPGAEIELITEQYHVYYLIIMHNPSTIAGDILEVSVDNEFSEDKMWQAIILSIPSLWMTAYVLYRLKRLKANSRSILDSSPSHLWVEEE